MTVISGKKLTDFLVGEDDFENLEIRQCDKEIDYFYNIETNSLIKQFILGTSISGINTCVEVKLKKTSDKYTPKLIFSKRKNKELVKEDYPIEESVKISSRIDFNECNDNFWILMGFIYTFKDIDIIKSKLNVVRNSQKELIDQIEMNENFIRKVLRTFPTSEAQSLLIAAKQDDVRNLHAAIKQAKNKQAVEELKVIIQNNHSEHDLQIWIRDNNWVFGIEYLKILDFSTIGIGSSADFVVESLDGYADLIELKKADHEKLFNYDNSHKSYYPTNDLSIVIGQTINYLKKMNDDRFTIKEQYNKEILKPRAKIVIGRSSIMEEGEKKALRLLNDTLHGIEILTYDEILARAKAVIKVYDETAI